MVLNAWRTLIVLLENFLSKHQVTLPALTVMITPMSSMMKLQKLLLEVLQINLQRRQALKQLKAQTVK